MGAKDTIPTPVSCPACAGSMIDRSSCRLCDGAGVTGRAEAEGWRREREHRLTGQFEVFKAIAAQYVGVLERRRTETARALARRGRELLGRFEEASRLPSGTPERTGAIKDLLDYQQQVIEFLRGSR